MKTNILSSAYHDIFPFSSEKGGDCSSINHQKMRFIAEHSMPLRLEQVNQMIIPHHKFLASGGVEGEWKTLQVADLVIGFYDCGLEKEGEQAVFERMNLSEVSFTKLEFPFANFCGVFAKKTAFNTSNLSYSLITDSVLEGANFENAQLKNVDFSRSNLRGARFVNANLSGADFENCDLTGVDFTGAKFSTARFPGALLDRVIY